jgi:ADP-ribose pyrophosphatase YjhB (NUDIX family)
MPGEVRIMPEPWLDWVKELRAIAQTGLHYANNPFDTERFQAVRAIASQMLEQGSSLGRAEILQLDAAEFGYATPKVDVRGACFRDGRILLVQEVADHGRWTLPGGWADPNETPATAAVREIEEESGFQARVSKLIGAFDRDRMGCVPPFPFHVYKLVFLCDLVGGAARESMETSGVAFFAEDDLPELSPGRVTAGLLRTCFAHHRQPALASEFQ